MQNIFKIIAAICFCCTMSSIQAQYTKTYDDPDAVFKSAKELFQKEQYSLAYPVFKNLYANESANTNLPVTIQSESKYYYIICGLKLNDATAEPLAKNIHRSRTSCTACANGQFLSGGILFQTK